MITARDLFRGFLTQAGALGIPVLAKAQAWLGGMLVGEPDLEDVDEAALFGLADAMFGKLAAITAELLRREIARRCAEQFDESRALRDILFNLPEKLAAELMAGISEADRDRLLSIMAGAPERPLDS